MMAMNPTVERLMLAMTEFEGWAPPSKNTPAGGSKSYRHHNPGNLRQSPFQSNTLDGFAIFADDLMGWMALQWDLLQKARGNTVTNLNGKSTLKELIYTWAPASDGNDPALYLAHVSARSGIKESTTLAEIFEF